MYHYRVLKMSLKKNLIAILFMVFIFILYYTDEAKHHPNTGGKTKTNFLAIEVALCQTYRKNLPDSIAEPIGDKIFKEEVVHFLMNNGYKFVNFDSLMHLDEWNEPFEYKKLSMCKAILRSDGEDTIPNTKDDITYTIDCYCF